MIETLKLVAVLAHPDDESLGMGGTLAKYPSEGVEVFLVTATRCDSGRLPRCSAPVCGRYPPTSRPYRTQGAGILQGRLPLGYALWTSF